MTTMDRKTEEDAKTSRIECVVPRGILLPSDDDGDERVALNVITLRELSGWEEEILVDDKIGVSRRLNQVVRRTITSISNDNKTIDDPALFKGVMASHPFGLSLGDSLTLFFRLREVTIGDEFRQTVECPSCKDDDGRPFSWTHIGSLTDLEIRPCAGNPAEFRRQFTTSRGNVVEWEMLTAQKEEEYDRKKISKDKATLPLSMRIVKLNGESPTKNKLKDLPYVERVEIRKRFDEEGGVNTRLEMECRRCGHEFKVTLDIGGESFFDPSAT